MKSRATRQKALLSEAIEKFDTFFDAEDLHEQVPEVGIATIYRFLKSEETRGKLFSFVCCRKSVYSKQQQHCHMINVKTGELDHFKLKDIDFLKDKVPGSIVSINVEVTYSKP